MEGQARPNTTIMNQLKKLHIEGFRSIKAADIEFGAMNVLIGANGAGKSNLIDFFRMLNYALSRGFQAPYLSDRGPASRIAHFGPKLTPALHAELEFETPRGMNFYRFSLAHVRGDDSFLFTHEEVQFHAEDHENPTPPIPLGPGGHRESGLSEQWSVNDQTVRFVKSLLNRCRVYQFHDTSVTSNLRGKPYVDNNRFLYDDGGNLAAVLFRLRETDAVVYQEIERTLQTILPWFKEFILEPEGPHGRQVIGLRWRMVDHGDYDFIAGQLSDGSLRIMALVSLLLLPADMTPTVCIIDEPELGLHPAAEGVVSGLIKHAALDRQVIVSTQSATFLDYFEPQDIVVVELEKGESSFIRQSEATLRPWLERYSLGQIWSKNVIGGRP
jgi:predicted ATPase